MQVVRTIAEARRQIAAIRQSGQSIGLVPTMGALHSGHAQLIAAAAKNCDYVVVSIFVNPLQFGPNEDFDRYPRQLPADIELCEMNGAKLVFAPTPVEIYPQKQYTYIEVAELTNGLCGATRPGHFRGVTTVVAKLLNITLPDVAFFGQKDAQQAAVLKRMVMDLNFPVKIMVLPIIRATDGLALSSRNSYLSEQERQAAPVLYKALQQAAAAVEKGERSAEKLQTLIRQILQAEELARIDYVEIVDADTLEPLKLMQGRVLIALAVYFGRTRLIDNIVVTVE